MPAASAKSDSFRGVSIDTCDTLKVVKKYVDPGYYLLGKFIEFKTLFIKEKEIESNAFEKSTNRRSPGRLWVFA